MHEQINAYHIGRYTRFFFKGSFKSCNKVYSFEYGCYTDNEQRQKRNYNAHQADYIIQYHLRVSHLTIKDMVSKLNAMPREYRAGNCSEYTSIGLEYGKSRKMPNIFLAEHEFHTFLVLANISIDDSKKLRLEDFNKEPNTLLHQRWVCDPWFNIMCPIESYIHCLENQSAFWQMKGKQVRHNGINQEAALWVRHLFTGEIELTRMTSPNGDVTENYYLYMEKDSSSSAPSSAVSLS